MKTLKNENNNKKKESLLHSRLSFEDLEAFKDIFKACDISESDSKSSAAMAVGSGAESVCVLRHDKQAKVNTIEVKETQDIFRKLAKPKFFYDQIIY